MINFTRNRYTYSVGYCTGNGILFDLTCVTMDLVC